MPGRWAFLPGVFRQMPVITVTLIRGYDADTRQRLCKRLTDATLATIDAPAEAVTVALHEVDAVGYMRGGQSRSPGKAPRPPAEICLDFLAAQGSRNLDQARALCADGFEMIFPGPARFTDFQDLIDWAAPRYASIAKRIERVEEAPLGASVAVWITGTLYGNRLDGSAFEGIRFVDRFEVAGGKIARQDVWNDLAESL